MNKSMRSLRNDFGLFVPLIAMIFFGFTFWVISHESRLSQLPKLADLRSMEQVLLHAFTESEQKALLTAFERMHTLGVKYIQCTSTPDPESPITKELSFIQSGSMSLPILPECPAINQHFTLWHIAPPEGGGRLGTIHYAVNGKFSPSIRDLSTLSAQIAKILDLEQVNTEVRRLDVDSAADRMERDAIAAKRRLELDDELKK